MDLTLDCVGGLFDGQRMTAPHIDACLWIPVKRGFLWRPTWGGAIPPDARTEKWAGCYAVHPSPLGEGRYHVILRWCPLDR